MICKYAEIFCCENVSSFCTAKATHIFSAKNIRILYIESAKSVNKTNLNELVKLTTLWTTGPCSLRILYNSKFILLATSLGTNAVIVMMSIVLINACCRIQTYLFEYIYMIIWKVGTAETSGGSAMLYSQTCLKQPPMGSLKCGCWRQVAA